MDADIIVVGAGPAGSTTAMLAARAGARVVLVDRSHFPRPKACAEYMSPGTWDVLERLGTACAVSALGPRQVPGMDVVSPAGTRFRLRYRRDGRSMHAFTLPRLQLDHALVTQATHEGVDLIEGVIVRRPLADSGSVLGVVASKGGREIRMRGSIVIVADGARSTLRSALGLSRPVRWPNRLGLIAHFDGPARLDGGFGQMHVSPGGYCGIAPLPGGGTNVGLVVHRKPRVPHRSPAQILEDWISHHPSLAEAIDGRARLSPVRGMSPVGARSSASAGPGFLLVGDAAGFFDPFTGEGIHRALVGGEIAARAALQRLERGDRPGDPAAYASARRSAFRKKEVVTAIVQTFVRFPRLLDYAAPRLESRGAAGDTLASVLGDIADAGEFLRLRPLWEALHP